MTNEQQQQEVHRNSLLKDVAKSSLLGKGLYKIIVSIACREIKSGEPTEKRELQMVQANVENLPLWVIVLFSKGGLSLEFLDALIAAMNGHLVKAMLGLCYAIYCFVANAIHKILLSII